MQSVGIATSIAADLPWSLLVTTMVTLLVSHHDFTSLVLEIPLDLSLFLDLCGFILGGGFDIH